MCITRVDYASSLNEGMASSLNEGMASSLNEGIKMCIWRIQTSTQNLCVHGARWTQCSHKLKLPKDAHTNKVQIVFKERQQSIVVRCVKNIYRVKGGN